MENVIFENPVATAVKLDEPHFAVVRTHKDGHVSTIFFQKSKPCCKYLRRHHDSVVSYKAYTVTPPNPPVLFREGNFSPRTLRESIQWQMVVTRGAYEPANEEEQRIVRNLRNRRRHHRAKLRKRRLKEQQEAQSALRPTRW